MPVVSGKKRLQKRARKSSSFGNLDKSIIEKHRAISRASALKKVRNLLEKNRGISSEAISMISLFCLHVDELTEAGIPYETIRALEKRHPMLLID